VTDKETERDEFHPRGTVVIATIFIVMLILLWGSIYLIMWTRGVTS
jgi:hypothetical protein